MKRILMVIENEESAVFMAEKAAKFSPEMIRIISFDPSSQKASEHTLLEKVSALLSEPGTVDLLAHSSENIQNKADVLKGYLKESDIDTVMLHRPILGKEEADFSLIKEILRAVSKTKVFLCGDNHWKKKPKVLATIDISDDNEKQNRLNTTVLNVAAELAEPLNTQLSVLSVIPISRVSEELAITEPDEIMMKKGAETQEKLEQFIRDHGEFENVEAHVAAGAPYLEIPSTARKLKKSIVVLGDVGRTGLAGLIIGNTAEKILKSLTVDALIVKH